MISKGNHVKFARFVWLVVGEEAKQRSGLQVNVYCRDINFFFRSMYNKAIIRFGYCDIKRIIKVSVKGLTSTLIILDITKTSSNYCLMCLVNYPPERSNITPILDYVEQTINSLAKMEFR